MGSPLGPVLANIFMCHFEERWVMNGKVRHSLWYRYVDDTFTMGAFFWDYSGIGIDGICVLLGAIPFSE